MAWHKTSDKPLIEQMLPRITVSSKSLSPIAFQIEWIILIYFIYRATVGQTYGEQHRVCHDIVIPWAMLKNKSIVVRLHFKYISCTTENAGYAAYISLFIFFGLSFSMFSSAPFLCSFFCFVLCYCFVLFFEGFLFVCLFVCDFTSLFCSGIHRLPFAFDLSLYKAIDHSKQNPVHRSPFIPCMPIFFSSTFPAIKITIKKILRSNSLCCFRTLWSTT